MYNGPDNIAMQIDWVLIVYWEALTSKTEEEQENALYHDLKL